MSRALLAPALAVLALASTALAALPARPGPPIKKTSVSWARGPWLHYDKGRCRFVRAPSRKSFDAVLRRQPGMRIVYTPAGTLTDVDVALNDSTERAAGRAAMKFSEYVNDFPSVRQPLLAAAMAAKAAPDVVISANVLPNLYPRIQATYERRCVPFVNEHGVAGTRDIPRFQLDSYALGVAEANEAKKIIEARGWDASKTWVLGCSDPAVTSGAADDVNRGYRTTLVELLGIPQDHVVQRDLVCTFESGTEKARQAMTEWLDGHPDAKYVTATSGSDDVYSQGLASALRDADFGDRALVVGAGGGHSSLELIASGDPIFAVDGHPNYASWGPAIVALAQQIALGQAVPSVVSPRPVVVTEANVDRFLR
jgi:ABC-type sugar transport system substrate-binding protein